MKASERIINEVAQGLRGLETAAEEAAVHKGSPEAVASGDPCTASSTALVVPFVDAIGVVVDRCGQPRASAHRDPVHVTERIGQLDCQQVEFSWRPGASVEDLMRFLDEFTGQTELSSLHVVGKA
ncbi:hypothetical protein [Streptomyces sp. NBC_00878]|uniref:hypothetical protein n=1 Tax=Streptomyces sp. NBC_00878 TaxID=2975854 RepID=UPI002B1D33A3|nr:hypothetical protein [Streptomyces sp. NBC_00878]